MILAKSKLNTVIMRNKAPLMFVIPVWSFSWPKYRAPRIIAIICWNNKIISIGNLNSILVFCLEITYNKLHYPHFHKHWFFDWRQKTPPNQCFELLNPRCLVSARYFFLIKSNCICILSIRIQLPCDFFIHSIAIFTLCKYVTNLRQKSKCKYYWKYLFSIYKNLVKW